MAQWPAQTAAPGYQGTGISNLWYDLKQGEKLQYEIYVCVLVSFRAIRVKKDLKRFTIQEEKTSRTFFQKKDVDENFFVRKSND